MYSNQLEISEIIAKVYKNCQLWFAGCKLKLIRKGSQGGCASILVLEIW